MSNRKEILIPKYSELISNLSSVGFPQVFPSLEDIDVVDMLLLFNHCIYTTIQKMQKLHNKIIHLKEI